MTVLKGEGKVPILFGTTSIAAGSLTHLGYLARPDLAGEWPTIVLLPSAWGLTSSAKDICRRLARQGFAVVAPDLYAGDLPPRSAAIEDAESFAATVAPARAAAVIEDIVEFIQNPAGHWSNAEDGYGLLSIGSGARHAVPAAGLSDVVALGMVSPPLAVTALEHEAGQIAGGDVTAPSVDLVPGLGVVTALILALSGNADDASPMADIDRARAAAPHAEWIVYDGYGADFINDFRDGFDQSGFVDAIERLTVFYEKTLPAGS